MITHSMLKIAIDRRSPDDTLHGLTYQLALIAALTRGERKEDIELDGAAAQGLSDLTGAIANAIEACLDVNSEQFVRDAETRQQGIRHLRRLGLAPVEPMDMADIIAAFGEYVDSLPEHAERAAEPLTKAERDALKAALLANPAEEGGAPRLTEPAPRASRRRAG